ncbi:unnamed protein product [Peniophora sp. CBMAI 1063]|nr:unnamed protein product [Peniophora sp. CBMAI 1063]
MAYEFANSAHDGPSDSPWDENPSDVRDAEWTKISSDFTNAGYREGITSGKEDALQEGFDAGYAHVGLPLGRSLGLLRGRASALAAFLSTHPDPDASKCATEAQDIATALSQIRFADIAPRDEEAEAHALEHLAMTGEDLDENEEIRDRRAMEQLEDLMGGVSTSTTSAVQGEKRPTPDDVAALRVEDPQFSLNAPSSGSPRPHLPVAPATVSAIKTNTLPLCGIKIRCINSRNGLEPPMAGVLRASRSIAMQTCIWLT